MFKTRITAVILLLAGFGIGYFIYASQTNPQSLHPFRLGLDLSGGAHLVYSADVSSIPSGEVSDAMATLRDVIERRVNVLGVSEPVVQTEQAPLLAGSAEQGKYRLIVDIPGAVDVKQATDLIGKTPVLEFMTPNQDKMTAMQKAFTQYQKDLEAASSTHSKKPAMPAILTEFPYDPTGLTGRFLSKAQLAFDQTTGQPYILLTFNSQGAQKFAEITKANIGKPVAIFLDRELGGANAQPISEPVVREEITGGKAQITGNFTVQEAKTLVGRLNSGALPVDKLTLISTQTIGPSLGAKALSAGLYAGIWGLALVALFMIVWYRLPGLLAAIALALYTVIMLALFMYIPVTLTAAGIAGFIISIGMAVDANVLIFERTKEELRRGEEITDAITNGFRRAWLSIRDSNISSIISALVLFWFGTSLIEGFALTFGLGVVVSMLSAITVTRTFLLAVATDSGSGFVRSLFGSGFSK